MPRLLLIPPPRTRSVSPPPTRHKIRSPPRCRDSVRRGNSQTRSAPSPARYASTRGFHQSVCSVCRPSAHWYGAASAMSEGGSAASIHRPSGRYSSCRTVPPSRSFAASPLLANGSSSSARTGSRPSRRSTSVRSCCRPSPVIALTRKPAADHGNASSPGTRSHLLSQAQRALHSRAGAKAIWQLQNEAAPPRSTRRTH